MADEQQFDLEERVREMVKENERLKRAQKADLAAIARMHNINSGLVEENAVLLAQLAGKASPFRMAEDVANSLRTENQRLLRKADALESENAALLDILREVEWQMDHEGDRRCPVCAGFNGDHCGDCRLGDALRVAAERAHRGRWISQEEAKEHWPDSSEPIRTQPLCVGGFNAMALGKDGADFRRQTAELLDKPAAVTIGEVEEWKRHFFGEKVPTAEAPSATDLDASDCPARKPNLGAIAGGVMSANAALGEALVSDFAGARTKAAQEETKEAFWEALGLGQSPQPWFAGLSMEEVHTQILLGRAPGSGQPGGAILVPEGFLNWLVSAQRPIPEKAAPNTISVRLTAEAERGVRGTDDLGLRGSEDTIAVYGEREIIGFLETVARLRREKDKMTENAVADNQDRRKPAQVDSLRSEVAEEAERLAKLLGKPFPGLYSWNAACEKSFLRLRKLFHGASEQPHGE